MFAGLRRLRRNDTLSYVTYLICFWYAFCFIWNFVYHHFQFDKLQKEVKYNHHFVHIILWFTISIYVFIWRLFLLFETSNWSQSPAASAGATSFRWSPWSLQQAMMTREGIHLILSGWWFQTWILFSIMYGMSSFPLTDSYFSRWLKPPTRGKISLYSNNYESYSPANKRNYVLSHFPLLSFRLYILVWHITIIYQRMVVPPTKSPWISHRSHT